ncbi:uncharacterized protein LOC116213121 isoform X2 [Punica granatum]|uniref:Uncharacterized protein LOC116213121 isoform X2 n=1 Tax=Punica granatum TaxID=22663 RepID=A0A6P8EEJ5_PUNGR|nr:uncharacterized protein LOC116213121 isoform X2 [Punica granatum]
MGKRRDRRMAAMSNPGRRLKLDLFAEPSGDLGGSSGQDELGGGLDSSKRSDGLPNSPSSSGQQPENPLLLLGQYSDDEEDNQSSRIHANANGDTSISNHNDQSTRLMFSGKYFWDISKGFFGLHQRSHVAGRITIAEHANRLVEASPVNESENLDVSMVADEAQEVKKDVVQDFGLLKELQDTAGGVSNDRDTSTSDNIPKEADEDLQNHVGGTFDAQVVGDVSSGWKMVLHEETNQYYYWNMLTGETSWEVPEVLAQSAEPSSDSMYVAAAASSHLLSQSESAGEFGAPVDGQIEKHGSGPPIDPPCGADVNQRLEDEMQDSMVYTKCESQMGHWSHLVELGECLLQRLSSLESISLPRDQEWISKCILEIEIRLSDMKSLSCHGSSLHPFWVYSEGQLRHLESVIDSKVGQLGNSTLNDSKALHDSVAREASGSSTSTEHKFESGHAKQEVLPAPDITQSSPRMDSLSVDTAVHREDVALPCTGSNVYSGEDIDMDVDMEVDDVTSEGHNIMVEKSCEATVAASDNSFKPEEPAEPPSVARDDGSPIPPPPDEEWIPPPPPDSEQIPPPPPDEPEPPYPLPPPTEVGQPLPYADQYSLSYPNSSYEMYGHSGVASNNYYAHAEGQVLVPQGPVSYEYTDSASVMNNVEPVTYYNIQDGTGPLIRVASLGSTQYQIQSGPFSYSALPSDQIGAGHGGLLSHSNVDLSDAHGKTGNGILEVASTSAPMGSATVEAPATTLVRDGVSEPSVSMAAASAAATVTTVTDAKVQSKVLRTKKRTVAVAPSLRSNKKVSSLVDKWKAAKEELEEEEEDEAKSALAMLEKKRQREIEEWHAQQIASGEAKDNANFQPLGGDWRERVKRKRAQANKEAASMTEEPQKENQPPDLRDLSKDLPSGWQAYWDESSKQVYYGNTLTSETTWIRPTK